MDAEERALLETTVRGALANSASADTALAELGWLEMLASERDDAIAIVFEAVGATNANATALDDVIVSDAGLEPGPKRAALLFGFGRSLATARARRLLPSCSSAAPSFRSRPCRSRRSTASIPTPGYASFAAPRASPRRPLSRSDSAQLHTRSPARPARCWNSRALHALDRVQFGRPVAQFQAVRHRLAEALVAVEALDATLAAAAQDPGDRTAALAKLTAGQTARTVATNCQQVLAGIGFTTDHPFHRYLKRTLLLDGLFGSADEIAVGLGRDLLADRYVPTLIEL